MKLIWASVRKASDLCSTTTFSLLKGLSQRGHEITFLSPKPFDENTLGTTLNSSNQPLKGFTQVPLHISARLVQGTPRRRRSMHYH